MEARVKGTRRPTRPSESAPSTTENNQNHIPLISVVPKGRPKLSGGSEENSLRLVENVKCFLGQFFTVKDGKLTREKNAYAKVLVAHLCTGLNSEWCAKHLGLDPSYKKNSCRTTVLVCIDITAYHFSFLQLCWYYYHSLFVHIIMAGVLFSGTGQIHGAL